MNPHFSFPAHTRSAGRRRRLCRDARHHGRRFRPSAPASMRWSRGIAQRYLHGGFSEHHTQRGQHDDAGDRRHRSDPGGGITNAWYRLTPDSSGSYVNGTWTRVASMSLQRFYYGSTVLPNGEVMVQGGEYSGTQSQETDSNAGEIYNPVTNTWSVIAPFPEPNFGDDCLETLPDGMILAGYSTGLRPSFTTPQRTRGLKAGPSYGTTRVTRRTG